VYGRRARVVREDLRDLDRVREVSLVEQLVGLLPERVGSPLSVANLSRVLDHRWSGSAWRRSCRSRADAEREAANQTSA
jgi:predicted AAA+ superfamily ATPase